MNKECDFLFLGDGELSFIFHALKESLGRKGYETEKCDINARNPEEAGMLPKLFVVDAEVLLAHPEARAQLYDRCIEFNRKIILVGYSNELKSLYDVSVTNVIAHSFERPVNNNEVIEKLEEIIEEYNRKGNKRNILIVDDSPTFLRLMSEWMENDYNVNVCPSASAAFHMIETNRPDLILLDYEMPVCNGAQFLQMLRSETATSGIPVMFLTSKDDAETVKSLIALKPQGYLLKNQSKDNTLHAITEFFIREQKR